MELKKYNANHTQVLKINQIVRTISETHKFDKDKLIAINTSDVENGVMGNGTLTFVDELKGQFKKTIVKDDILFSEIRPANRRFAKVTTKNTKDYVVSTKLMVLRKYNEDVDLEYFYYCLTNQPFLDILQRRAENRIGSFPQITFDLLSEYAFPIPPISEQKRISSVISTLDKKIALNRQINQNLEALAKQFYDYWFVQFDFPNEEGKPYKSSGGKMVWNEKLKREIPEGWDACKIKDYLRIFTGKKDVSKAIPGDYKFFSCAPEPITSNEYIYDGAAVLVSGNGSYTGRVSYYKGKFDLYQRTYACVPIKDEDTVSFFFYTLRYLFQPVFSGGKHGSSIPYIVLGDLADFTFAYNRQIVKLFVNIVKTMFDLQFMGKEDDEQLTKQRNELLPLLMNGQITIE